MPTFSVSFSKDDVIELLKNEVENLITQANISGVKVQVDSGYNNLVSITLTCDDYGVDEHG